MPTLIRLLVLLLVLAGIAYGAMFALVALVDPGEEEVSIRIPARNLLPAPARAPLVRREIDTSRPVEPAPQATPAAPAAQPEPDAADGEVVYSGSGLRGYGELIIIKHSPEFLSAYGHNRRRLVNEGEHVRAGQPIAEMGRTGADRDMLHFEIRRGGNPVDPAGFLPRR